jgi:hypothetical protein
MNVFAMCLLAIWKTFLANIYIYEKFMCNKARFPHYSGSVRVNFHMAEHERRIFYFACRLANSPQIDTQLGLFHT